MKRFKTRVFVKFISPPVYFRSVRQRFDSALHFMLSQYSSNTNGVFSVFRDTIQKECVFFDVSGKEKKKLRKNPNAK